MGKKGGKARRNAKIAWILGIVIVAIVSVWALVGFGVLSIPEMGKGKTSDSTGDKTPNLGPFAYSYEGKNVKLDLEAANMYTAAAVDPTYYIYDEKPANWDKSRVSVEDGYITSLASASGSATMTEKPGIYYVRAVLSGYYDKFLEVEVPVGGEVPLTQYNDNGQDIEKVKLIDIETLSVSNQDMGITTNETSDKIYHVYVNFNVDDNEGYILDEIKLREDSTYSFATDTDGNGVYDEGINKIVFSVGSKSHTLFDVAASIDEFSGDDEALVNVDDVLYPENGVVSLKFTVTCDQTLDTTGDADEKCGNGEDFLDDVILVDGAGNTATFHLVG